MTAVRDHWWWRPGWRIGRRAYTFHITFDDDAAVEGCADLRRLASEYQQAFASLPGLDLVPLRWLHLTMQNVGFTDEVSEEQVDAVAAAVRGTALQEFELTFAAAEVRKEAIALRPTPAEPVQQLRTVIRAAVEDVLGTVPDAPEHAEGFEPHVSVAYSNREGPSAPIEQVAEHVRPAPVIATVRAAKLIVLDRDDRVYKWTVRSDVPLGNG